MLLSDLISFLVSKALNSVLFSPRASKALTQCLLGYTLACDRHFVLTPIGEKQIVLFIPFLILFLSGSFKDFCFSMWSFELSSQRAFAGMTRLFCHLMSQLQHHMTCFWSGPGGFLSFIAFSFLVSPFCGSGLEFSLLLLHFYSFCLC